MEVAGLPNIPPVCDCVLVPKLKLGALVTAVGPNPPDLANSPDEACNCQGKNKQEIFTGITRTIRCTNTVGQPIHKSKQWSNFQNEELLKLISDLLQKLAICNKFLTCLLDKN